MNFSIISLINICLTFFALVYNVKYTNKQMENMTGWKLEQRQKNSLDYFLHNLTDRYKYNVTIDDECRKLIGKKNKLAKTQTIEPKKIIPLQIYNTDGFQKTLTLYWNNSKRKFFNKRHQQTFILHSNKSEWF